MGKKTLSAHSYKCLGCGADMVFSPKDSTLFCPICKGKQRIEGTRGFKKHRLDEFVAGSDNNESWAAEENIINCPNCGAGVGLQKYQVTLRCPYCSSQLVANTTSLAGLTPDAVVPFKFDKERAEEIFRNKITKNAYVPSKFKRKLNTYNIEEYYFPAFVYDAQCRSSYQGRLYKTYTVRRNGQQVTQTKYYSIQGTKDTKHEGIEIEASTKITQTELEWICPYNIAEAMGYNKAYVAGYPLETYSVGVEETNKHARQIIDKKVEREILSGYNYDGISYLNIDSYYYNEQFSYCVLPLYRVNYKYKNKSYSNVINGQTGAFGGKTPKSGFKIALTVLAPILLIAAVILAALLI